MIDVLGFWSSVTLIIAMPFWFFGYRITRWILSIAKKNAPEIPREIRGRQAWSHWECHLYPRWAHKLNRMFGGGLVDTGGVLILGILTFFPTVLLLVGAFNKHETVIGAITMVSGRAAPVMGWLILAVASLSGLYMAVSRGSRLVGLVQIQEMKEKRSENR